MLLSLLLMDDEPLLPLLLLALLAWVWRTVVAVDVDVVVGLTWVCVCDAAGGGWWKIDARSGRCRCKRCKL